MTMMNIDEEFLIKRIILLEKCPCERCKKEAEKTKELLKKLK